MGDEGLDVVPPSTPDELDALDQLLGRWALALPDQGMAVGGVEKVRDVPRCWYVRMDGEQKTNFSILFTVGQRTLHYESYFMPEPEENVASVQTYLLTRNARLFGLSYVIGAEQAVYLAGQIDNRWVDEAELDRILGSIWMETEASFRPAMRLGFASRFTG